MSSTTSQPASTDFSTSSSPGSSSRATMTRPCTMTSSGTWAFTGTSFSGSLAATMTCSVTSQTSQTSSSGQSQSMTSFPIPIGSPFDPPQSSSPTSSTQTSTSTSSSSSSTSLSSTTSSSSSTSSSDDGSATSDSLSISSTSPNAVTVTYVEASTSSPVIVTLTSHGHVMRTTFPMVTVISTHGQVVTQTSVVPNPTLSPNTAGNESQVLANKGAVAAISVVVGSAVCSIIICVALVYRRRRKRQMMERDVATAAMAAAGISQAAPFDDEDRFTPSMVQRQRTFEDGSPFTSALDQDFEQDGGEFDPYFMRNSVAATHRGALQLEPFTRPSPPSPSSSQALSSPVGYGYGSLSSPNRSSSQGHDTLHSGNDRTIASSSSSHSPPAYTALNGSFQRRSPLRRGSSEESCAPPVPAYIFTSFGSSHHTSVQRDDDAASARSVYSQPSDACDVGGLSPLDPTLGSRLRSGNESGGTVGLYDNEDYSARPKLEIRNFTGSQRTFGTLESGQNSDTPVTLPSS